MKQKDVLRRNIIKKKKRKLPNIDRITAYTLLPAGLFFMRIGFFVTGGVCIAISVFLFGNGYANKYRKSEEGKE